MQNTHDSQLDEQLWAERFSHDIDQFLGRDESALSEQPTTEYTRMLNLARALASPLDPADSSLRYTLRQRLLSQTQSQRRSYQSGISFWQRPFAFVSLALVAFALGSMLLIAPVSAWGASVMLGLHSLNATVIPTAAQTATATPSRTAVMPTAALLRDQPQLVAARVVASDGTPVVSALSATAVPVASGMLVTAVVR